MVWQQASEGSFEAKTIASTESLGQERSFGIRRGANAGPFPMIKRQNRYSLPDRCVRTKAEVRARDSRYSIVPTDGFVPILRNSSKADLPEPGGHAERFQVLRCSRRKQ
jgi:hypothetical protein